MRSVGSKTGYVEPCTLEAGLKPKPEATAVLEQVASRLLGREESTHWPATKSPGCGREQGVSA